MKSMKAYVGAYGCMILGTLTDGWVSIFWALMAFLHLILLYKARD